LTLALPYLQSRGISDVAAKEYQLGYVLDPPAEHEQYKGRLSIPYVTPTGAVDMKFRCIAEHDCKDTRCVKYQGESGASSRMYGVLALEKDSRFIAVCEGELDTVAANTIAGIPAVGINGANKWKPHYQYLFEGYDEVIVLHDGDDGGRKLADTVTSALYNSRAVPLPDGEDVNSFLLEHGAKALRERAGLSEPGISLD
jgi:DNA primase